jgi:hypothetical protein
MGLLWEAVASARFQRLKLFKDLLALSWSRRQAMAWLEGVEASNRSADARQRVRHILRAMLRLPEASLQAPASLEAPGARVQSKRQGH